MKAPRLDRETFGRALDKGLGQVARKPLPSDMAAKLKELK